MSSSFEGLGFEFFLSLAEDFVIEVYMGFHEVFEGIYMGSDGFQR